MKFTLNPPYFQLLQRRNLGGPTCLSMILLRRGEQMHPEVLAQLLGVKVLDRDLDVLSVKLETTTVGAKDLGLQFEVFSTKNVGELLNSYGLHYDMRYAEDIHKFETLLIQSLDAGGDVLLNFRMEPFFEKRAGQYCLVSAYDVDTKELTLTDCNPERKSSWTAEFPDVWLAMQDTYDGKLRGALFFHPN